MVRALTVSATVAGGVFLARVFTVTVTVLVTVTVMSAVWVTVTVMSTVWVTVTVALSTHPAR